MHYDSTMSENLSVCQNNLIKDEFLEEKNNLESVGLRNRDLKNPITATFDNIRDQIG